MSAGEFAKATYQSNVGDLYRITIQPETETLILNGVTNTRPTGTPPVGQPKAKVSGSRRKIGVNTRLVRFRFTGTPPAGYLGGKSNLTLPVLTSAMYNGLDEGQTGTYTIGGTAFDVIYVGRSPERIK